MTKVIFETFGCRLNVAESGELSKKLIKAGYIPVSFGDTEVSFIIINTCTVTSKADSDCRNCIRKAQKTYPKAQIIVIGCYAQVSQEEILELGVDLVLGNTQKPYLLDYLERLKDGPLEKACTISQKMDGQFWTASTSLNDERTRAFLKIQDGCNYFCSYCIIPYARGLAPSAMPLADVLCKVKELVDLGLKEIVLTGINLGSYQTSTGESFAKLLQSIVEKTSLERIRLSSIEPNLFNKELIDVLKSSKRIMPSFHIPLQSGSDKILTLMKRKYQTKNFENVIQNIKMALPNSFIGIDIMCGFPGENEEDFEDSYKFIEKLKVDSLHVFPYSERKSTPAASFEGKVSQDIKKNRVQRLLDLSKEKTKTFVESCLGKEFDVLFEKRNKDNLWGGHTENFLYVKTDSQDDLHNKVLRVKVLKNLNDNKALGTIIS